MEAASHTFVLFFYQLLRNVDPTAVCLVLSPWVVHRGGTAVCGERSLPAVVPAVSHTLLVPYPFLRTWNCAKTASAHAVLRHPRCCLVPFLSADRGIQFKSCCAYLSMVFIVEAPLWTPQPYVCVFREQNPWLLRTGATSRASTSPSASLRECGVGPSTYVCIPTKGSHTPAALLPEIATPAVVVG